MKPSYMKSKMRLNVETACFCALICLFLLGVVMLPDCARAEPAAQEEAVEEEAKEEYGFCPYFRVEGTIGDCLYCHVRGERCKEVKETDPHDLYDYPSHLQIHEDDQGRFGFYELEGGIGDHCPWMLERAFRYLKRHNVNRITIDISSPGGSVFAGWETVTVIQYWQANGFDVTTQVRSIAASAAFTIYCAADKRLISPFAELMQHELFEFTFFELTTPTDSKKKTKLLTHLQDTVTAWLARKVGMTKEELAQKLKDREYWLNGVQAKHMGWATGYTMPIDPETEKGLLENVEQY